MSVLEFRCGQPIEKFLRQPYTGTIRRGQSKMLGRQQLFIYPGVAMVEIGWRRKTRAGPLDRPILCAPQYDGLTRTGEIVQIQTRAKPSGAFFDDISAQLYSR